MNGDFLYAQQQSLTLDKDADSSQSGRMEKQ